VRQANGRVGRVDALPSGAGGAEGVGADVLGFKLDLDFVGFWQHRDSNRRGMYAPLLLGLRHALDTMHAALIFELAINALAADQGR